MTILAGQRLTTQVLLDNMPHTITNGYAATTVQTTTTTTEVAYLTSASMTLRNGRAYRITISTLITGNTADKARLWVRRTNVTGSVLLDTQQVSIDVTSSNGRRTFQNIAVNTSGADLTGVLVATIQRSTGSTAAVGNNASSTSPSYMQIEDIGLATDYPTAPTIT